MAARAARKPGGDFHGWWRASQRLAAGEEVYFAQHGPEDEMPNKHGLVFLWLFRPFSLLPQTAAEALWVLLSVLMLGHCLMLLSRRLALDGSFALDGSSGTRSLLLGLGLVAAYIHLLLKYEQTGLFLLWLFVCGAELLERGRPLRAGLVFGLSAATKLLPFALLPWLCWTQRWRAAIGLVLATVLSFAIPALVYGPSSTKGHVEDYVAMLREDAAHDSHHWFHQSLRPALIASVADRYDVGHLADEKTRAVAEDWQGVRNFAVALGLASWSEVLVILASSFFALLCAWAIPRRGPRASIVGELGLVLAAMTLISPLAWKHYYAWLLPLAIWLAHASWGRASVELSALQRRAQGSARLAFAAFVLLLTLPHKGVLGRELARGFAIFHGYAWGLAVVVFASAIAIRRAVVLDDVEAAD